MLHVSQPFTSELSLRETKIPNDKKTRGAQ